ncbi:unnamed protein product [Cyprideis torosa]|uniref:folate gamma-glutamyl hydrolase n=1 Tax=Cyprideis torosa TaxID=163714 RepID=A0A7R8ZMS0_9CRUS|nr:unnamed protein product [Cyprideis torosa]CAG0889680.1 unnamed protein product [Cyprideis torosa]
MAVHSGILFLLSSCLVAGTLAGPLLRPPTNAGPLLRPPTNALTSNAAEENLRPVIGILAQEIPGSLEDMEEAINKTSYIAASYVKYLEAAGARVVPVLDGMPDEYYQWMVQNTNGILFPGGSANITSVSAYGRAGRVIYDLATLSHQNGNPFPIWGTCLGFELLVFLASGLSITNGFLTSCDSSNVAYPLEFTEDFRESSLWRELPPELETDLRTQNLTSNFHIKCYTKEALAEQSLDEFFHITSLNHDEAGKEFVSSLEAREFPFFGVQFHPEKPSFEWDIQKMTGIPHTKEAVEVGQFLSNVFVEHARIASPNRFPESHSSLLIYNFPVTYIGDVSSSFEQAYFFSNRDQTTPMLNGNEQHVLRNSVYKWI